ncbi:glycoside hydrolase family 6 protein [Rhizomonospora bruguierae]|uniref:glycoside hydrolase family 6 protein n=1 Tax=Rhizomonospora bruguierae TaxID=1581705 RepID=UPI001BD0DC5F|nr:glycoside hydrolase family 6 protein [Micromonospora sp. NBRC 107566]
MRLVSSRTRRGKLAITAAAAALGAGGLAVLPALPAAAATGCSVTYTITNSWQGGFQGDVTIRNVGDAWTSWQLKWTWSGSQQVTQGWSGKWSQSGTTVTVGNESWNGSVPNGGSVTGVGFLANGSAVTPSSFSVNGVTCNGSTPTTGPTTRPPTTNPPTSGPTTRPPTGGPTTNPPTGGPTTNPPQGTHVDNPYAGAKGYVNPDWKAKADAETGGSRVSNTPTGVWMDRIAAINGTPGARGMRAHLDEAVAQGAGYIQFVIYDLPNRDCSALASNGELKVSENGINRYKTEYIDPIAAIQADSKYRNIRIINIIEIDSLPNLITNTNVAACAEAQSSGAYVQGVQYALSKLHAAGSNIYNYIDAAHHGWIGWSDNFGPSADLFASTVRGATGGFATVDGFITDTANYSALTEPYFNINTQVNGQSVRQSKWVDWNDYVDELTFAQAFRTKLTNVGFPQSIGMLIDTSRNGWGGPNRPTKASTATTVDQFVNESRVDRRIHAGNWCNQSGAGLGERPRANPATGIDAYVWIKPPGESDGSSSAIANDEGKGFDRMCDPTYGGNERNGNNQSGAMANAPVSGHWFSAQFQELMRNAYPAL